MSLTQVERKLEEVGFRKYTGHVFYHEFMEINIANTVEVILPNKKKVILKPNLEIDGKKIDEELNYEATVSGNRIYLYFLPS